MGSSARLARRIRAGPEHYDPTSQPWAALTDRVPNSEERPRRSIAVVVQRYDERIVGGAEWHARSLVETLARYHEVTVLTTCAHDAASWVMHYPPGEDRVHGVRVLRFSHPERNAGGRAKVPLGHKLRFLGRRLLDSLGGPRAAHPIGDDACDGHLFLRRQGPTCEDLIEALRQGSADWDVVVFFTALYYPTAEGLPVWGTRSVLVPTLHDEKPMVLPWFHRVFATAGETLWNTHAEQRLARRFYGANAAAGHVVGAGVRVQAPTAGQTAAARARYALPERYLVYVGRIEKGKGCAELLAAWQAVATQAADAVLVFVGQGSLPITTGPQVRCTGFIDGAERDALVAGAVALVMPSRHESLSLVLLEALALGVPALANGHCEPLVDHVAASGAGETYRGVHALRGGLLRALARPRAERKRLGDAGRRYVAARYAPAIVERAWLDAIERAAA